MSAALAVIGTGKYRRLGPTQTKVCWQRQLSFTYMTRCAKCAKRLCSLQHDRWLSPSRRRCQYLHSAFLAQLSNITNKYNLIWTSVSHATQILRTETALKSPPFSVIVIVKPRIMLDISTCCHSAPNDFTHTHLLSAQRRATTQTLWHEEKKRN